MTDEIVKVAIAGFIMILTQLWKEFRPTQAEQDKKYIAVVAITISGIMSVLAYLAVNNPIVASNTYEVIVLLFGQLISGALLGAAAVGMYSSAKAFSLVRSVDEILVAKTNLVASGDVTVSVPQVGDDIKNIEVKVTDVQAKKLKAKTPK